MIVIIILFFLLLFIFEICRRIKNLNDLDNAVNKTIEEYDGSENCFSSKNKVHLDENTAKKCEFNERSLDVQE